MFARKKPQTSKARKHDMTQFGLTEIPDDFDPSLGLVNDNNDDNDSDLEAELAAIAGDNNGRANKSKKPKPSLLPSSELDQMIADSLKDVSDDDNDDAEDDPDLLGELHDITGGVEEPGLEVNLESAEGIEEPPQTYLPTTTMDTAGIIRQRIDMYKQAEANAKAANESAKARRFGRGLKTLMDLLKKANAGQTINVDDIPPEVSITTSKPSEELPSNSTSNITDDKPTVPLRTAPPPPTSQKATETSDSTPKGTSSPDEVASSQPDNELLEQMLTRQREYKAAALQSKRAGDTAMALQFLKIVKQFDLVMQMCKDGQKVDLSDMPPHPDQFKEFMAQMEAAANTSKSSPPADMPNSPSSTQTASTVIGDDKPSETHEATSLLEALQQRLDKYKAVADAAKAEENTSKARRFGRIVKQYEEAVKLYKAGKAVPYDELPVPPGFGPLPTENSPVKTASSSPAPQEPEETSPSVDSQKKTLPQRPELTTRISGNQQKNNLAEQQMKILLERQKEFKLAALDAKKSGEIEQAKEYLKIYKGFDALLNAASSGLPVDLDTLPIPPSQKESLEASFAIIGTEDCDPNDDMADIGIRVEEQLVKQLMMCKNTRDHHKAMGDIAGMNRFEHLALTVQKDLDLIRYSKRKNLSLPKFHYEKRSFNIVHCNTDLTDNELEIVVVRGINYSVANPKDVDTYVKIEFPLLNDELFKTKTGLIRDSDNPSYDQRFKVEIQRGNRQFQRIFKRHAVKLEVYSRGGFLRSDVLIGNVNVKLQPLETKCDIHDTFNLMEGRRAVGGKLEVKVRVRNPLLTKQMENITEKWLVLDSEEIK